MVKTIADRLAEALAELMHQRVRKEWGFPDKSNITNEDLIKEGYRGFYYDHGHIAPIDKSLSYIDFSITKNVFFLFLNASLMLFVFLFVASKYRNKKTTPKGRPSH